MRDWSYKDAMVIAEQRFQECIRTHLLIPAADMGCACVCGWRGANTHLWREHVDTACIVQQVKQNRRG